jgi:small subunit ribosomal protein S19
MNRVNWKGPYTNNNLLEKIKNFRTVSKEKIKTMSKSSTILPKFVGLTFWVYNGKTFTIIKVIDEMVGHKLGEFILTRKKFSYKKNK